MEEQSSIYKSQENEQISQEQSNIDNITNNISNKNIENIPSQLTQFPSKAQIYHYEKTIHDLSIQNSSLSSRIENLLLQLEKSNALIDSHKTENDILKSQIINQTNNNKILEEKNMENEIKIKELKSLNEKIVKNQKIKYETLVGEISEKEKIIQKLNEQLKAKEESIKYFTINDNLEKKYQLNYKNELEKERNENKKLQEKINQLNNNKPIK